jgi:hypothetical protein
MRGNIMKKYINSTTNSASIEFTSYIDDDLLTEVKELPTTAGSVDTWGVLECISEADGIGLDYNLYIDNTSGDMENVSAFYVMRYNPKTDYWETDYSDYVHYEIDFNDPNWKSDAEKFAKDYLQELIRDNN